jgi:hypothetical protein
VTIQFLPALNLDCALVLTSTPILILFRTNGLKITQQFLKVKIFKKKSCLAGLDNKCFIRTEKYVNLRQALLNSLISK